MIPKREIIPSKLNDIGNNFDYRKKEILFDRFKGWFDNTTFILDNDKFMGWGKYRSDCGTLVIGTACFDGGEWLDTVTHTVKANNPYNNFVNAIAYWDMMNKKGRSFWLDYYSKEIIIKKATLNGKINELTHKIDFLLNELSEIDKEVNILKTNSHDTTTLH